MNWKAALLSKESVLRDAIDSLNKSNLQIVVVVDGVGKLLGTITDGDIRRALIGQASLETSVLTVMNDKPCSALVTATKEMILKLMEERQLSQIPILNNKGEVVFIETIHQILKKKVRSNIVFLMAGGFGSRLHPLTENCPKPLLSVGEKPILEIIIESFVKSGFYRFYISTHFLSNMIMECIGNGDRWGVDIRYIEEDMPLGTGGALGLLPKEEVDEPLIMMNSDILTNLDFNKLLSFHESHKKIATMCVREFEYRIPYGVIEGDGLRVMGMVEKPAHKCFINTGIYVLSPMILNAISSGERIDMPQLLQKNMNVGEDVMMFPIHEYWLDIGRIEDYQRAQYDIAGVLCE